MYNIEVVLLVYCQAVRIAYYSWYYYAYVSDQVYNELYSTHCYVLLLI